MWKYILKGDNDMLNNNRIGYLHFWCQKVLPLVYDNSLSYLETLYKMKEKLNEVIKFTNDIPEYIDKKFIEEFDEEHLKELISEVFRTIEDAISANNEGTNTHFSTNYPNTGTLVWHDNKLYKTMHPIDAGDTVIPDSNIELVNFGDMFNEFLNEVKTRFTDNDDGNRETSSTDRPIHDLVWLNNTLYEVIKPIAEGNAYIYSGTNKNVEATNLDKIFDYLLDLISSEINAREEADDTLQDNIGAEAHAREEADGILQDNIDAEVHAREEADGTLQDNIDAEAVARRDGDNAINNKVGDLTNLQTPNKTSIVNAINSLTDYVNSRGYVTPEDFGAVGDGVTDDSAAINAAIASDKPVLFMHNYAVGSPIEITHPCSDYVNGNGFTLFALPTLDDYVVKINNLYGALVNIIIDCGLHTSVTGGLCIYSTEELQSQFYIIDNIYIKNALVGIQYGIGITNAQSEFTIHAYKTRSVLKALDINQPNGFLWITDSHLDVTPYEWTSEPNEAEKLVVNQHVGSVTFDNCTLESPAAVGRGMILYDAIVTNCIIEIAGENVSIINYYAPISTELTFENCRFYESQGSYLVTVGGGYTNCKLTIKDCNIYGSGGYLIYSTIKTDIVLHNIFTTKSIVGNNINILDASGVKTPTINYQPFNSKHYFGAKIVKASEIIFATCRVVHNNAGLLTATYFSNGSVVSSETLQSFNGAGEFYFTFEKAINCDCVQFATSDGAVEVCLYTVDNGDGFTAASLPLANFPNGSVVADSTGATAGWIVTNGHVTAL